MPLPNPHAGESEQDFVSRCISTVVDDGTVDNTPDGRAQAAAMCFGHWRDSKKEAAPMTTSRAYSLLRIKSFDEDQRIIEGVASTPTADRVGDIVEPTGAKFSLPMPLLWQHDHTAPIGHVLWAKAEKNGIPFRAQIAKTDVPGTLKDRLDEAWQTIKLGLVRAVSIGFNAIKFDWLENGKGMHFKEWEWLELSAVTIPANMDATISVVRSLEKVNLLVEKPAPPKPGESQDDFLSRCIPVVLNEGTTHNPSQAAAICHSMWDEHHKPKAASGQVLNHRPASGQQSLKPAGASARPKKESKMPKTIAEQISAFEATRAAKDARRLEIQNAANDEGRTKDEAEQEEFDNLTAEIKRIDRELVDLKEMQTTSLSHTRQTNASETSDNGGNSNRMVRVEMRNSLPKGTLFTRYVMAMAAARGAPLEALEYAKRWDSQTPEVSAYIRQKAYRQKADPMLASDNTDLNASAGPLVYAQNLEAEFVSLLYPATVVGRIPNLDRVPFNVRIPVQTGGATVGWVGEAAAKGVSNPTFDFITMTWSKIAGIVVLSDELVRLSTPSAEQKVRTDLIAQIAKFMDEQFLLASVTATADHPASITNGVSGTAASGTTADDLSFDLNAALATFDAANLSTQGLVVVMTPALARGISTLRNSLGQYIFGSVTPSGGTLLGYPVLVSNSCPSGDIILIQPTEVLLADDGNVTIDASNQATLDMAGGDTPAFSLWQKNCLAIRAERWIRWQKKRDSAVALITGGAYAPSPTTA